MQIAIMGFGTIGSGVAELLLKNQASIVKKSGQTSLDVKHILDIRDFPDHPLSALFTKNFEDIVNDPSVGVVVECMGGLTPAYDYVSRCLAAGKNVVSSNKELVAAKGDILIKLAEENNVILAPMAGVTDLPFRVICRRYGCGMTVSEMVSAKGLIYKNVKTTEMLRIDAAERPTAIQLFGSVPSELAEAAKMVEASGADIIDFNMGCPVPKIVNNGEGSALMKNPQLAYEVLAAMVEAVKIPVTVKFRAGWDENNINADGCRNCCSCTDYDKDIY